MTAYMYQAALVCSDCAERIKRRVDRQLRDGTYTGRQDRFGLVDVEDSDVLPQGPYPDGGGESDSPAHCDVCQVFLENPLTTDGCAYVREALRERKGNSEVLDTWAAFYGLEPQDVD